MKPYYESGGITIYHGDCREVLPGISADTCITDPPYNVGLTYGAGTNDTRADYRDWCAEWFGAIDAPLIAVSSGVANVGMWWTIKPPTWVLAWHKPAAMGRCVVGFNNWEPILLYGKPRGTIVDVIRAGVIPSGEVEGHPCPKPYEWAAKQIALLSPEGGSVLDPFMGSGTTAKAAKNLNRPYIGIEIEERYCEIAAKRLSQEVLAL